MSSSYWGISYLFEAMSFKNAPNQELVKRSRKKTNQTGQGELWGERHEVPSLKMVISRHRRVFCLQVGCSQTRWVPLHREITSFLPLFPFQDIVLDITPSVSSGKLQTSLALDRSC